LTLDTHDRWRRAMRGHAVANAVPVIAANRIGTEQNDGATQSYYGHSFIADHTGELVASFGAEEEGVLTHRFDLAAIERYRAEWGFFRDRRPDLYAKSII
jgi:N-carbamoylputrescine amidase